MIYKSTRQKAYRNLLVCAINEGLRRKLFTLQLDSWSESSNQAHVIDFKLPDELPARAVFRDIGFGEVSVVVAVNPMGSQLDGRSHDTKFRSGDAFALGWLEREKGIWLQFAPSLFNCKRNLLPRLASLEVEPVGFCDNGELII